MATSESSIDVLYVDGEDGYASRLVEGLRTEEPGVAVEHLSTAEAAVERLQRDTFDCVLAHRDLPDADGMTLLTRSRRTQPAVPFILLVAPEDVSVATRVVRAGATDYVLRRAPGTTATVAGGRIRVAASRRRSLTDYQQVFEEATVGIVIHHPETGDIIDINPWMSELLGYDRSELLRMSVGDFSAGVEPYTQVEAEAHIRRAATEGPQTFEWLDERQDGERVWVDVSLRRTVIGGHDRVLAIVRDITERKERERELERETERLEEFTGIVSHDLRNPLNVARGWVEQSIRTGDTDTEALERVESALSRMDSIIEDSLTLAREGREIEATEPVPVGDRIEEWWQLTDTDDARLDLDEPFTVEADPRRLRRLLENLFRNAAEHGSIDSPSSTDEVVEQDVGDGRSAGTGDAETDGVDGAAAAGPVTVRVGPFVTEGPVETTVGPAPEGREVEGFYVADDGSGIPPEDRATVFEPGRSAHSEGTGLGLAIVRRVADAHGWAIRLRESDGGGARFEFLGVTLHGADAGGE